MHAYYRIKARICFIKRQGKVSVKRLIITYKHCAGIRFYWETCYLLMAKTCVYNINDWQTNKWFVLTFNGLNKSTLMIQKYYRRRAVPDVFCRLLTRFFMFPRHKNNQNVYK